MYEVMDCTCLALYFSSFSTIRYLALPRLCATHSKLGHGEAQESRVRFASSIAAAITDQLQVLTKPGKVLTLQTTPRLRLVG
jgi:hypothetical protein